MTITLQSSDEVITLCYTRTSWAGTWTERPLLEAISVTDQAAPAHATAVLRHRYGQTLQPAIGSRAEDSTAATVARPDLVGQYVRVSIDGGALYWYGIIVSERDTEHGRISGSIDSGIITYAAFGLTYLLERSNPVIASKILKANGSTAIIKQAIPFNGGSELGMVRPEKVGQGNYDQGAQCFADRTIKPLPRLWKAKDAVRYLLTNFAPRNIRGTQSVEFRLSAASAAFLDYELPYTPYDGKTVWQILNQIIDRRRGLGWNAIVSSDRVEVQVWSQFTGNVTLPSGKVIPRNANQTAMDLGTYVNIMDATIERSAVRACDIVVVEGERAGSVLTLQAGSQLESDWTSTEETEYNTAASGETEYAAMNDADKHAWNQDWRARESLAPVFAWWRVSDTWDGLAYDYTTDDNIYQAFPLIKESGDVDTNEVAPVWVPSLRVMDYVPIVSGVDYSGEIQPGMRDTEDRLRDFRPPLVVYECGKISGTGSSNEGWLLAERLNQAVDAGSADRPFEYHVDVRNREDAFGLELVTSGAPQHFIASDLYSSNDTFEDIPSGEGLNSSAWLATVYVQQHARVRVTWPKLSAASSGDVARVRLIRLSDCFLDYMVPGTVYDSEGGTLQLTTQGGYLRDDRERMRDIARMAFAWYGSDRRSLDLAWRGTTTGLAVGTLVTTLQGGGRSTTVHSCITHVTLNLEGGTTSLQTQFGEFDVEGVAG